MLFNIDNDLFSEPTERKWFRDNDPSSQLRSVVYFVAMWSSMWLVVIWHLKPVKVKLKCCDCLITLSKCVLILQADLFGVFWKFVYTAQGKRYVQF